MRKWSKCAGKYASRLSLSSSTHLPCSIGARTGVPLVQDCQRFCLCVHDNAARTGESRVVVGVLFFGRSCVGGRLGDLHLVVGWRAQVLTLRHSDVEYTALVLLAQRTLRLPRRFIRAPFDLHVRLV